MVSWQAAAARRSHYCGTVLWVCSGCPGLNPNQRDQSVEGGDSAPLLLSFDTPPALLHPALGSSADGRCEPTGISPEEATNWIRGMEHLGYENSLEKRKLQENLIKPSST